jgi:hypothetical protein
MSSLASKYHPVVKRSQREKRESFLTQLHLSMYLHWESFQGPYSQHFIFIIT